MNKIGIVAAVISRVFDPFILFFLLMLLGAVRGGVYGYDLFELMMLVVFGMIVPPMVILFWAVRAKKVSNWDISIRRQRVYAFCIFSLFLLFDGLIVKSFHVEEISQLFSLFISAFIGIFCITLFWKISGHVTTLALTIGIIMHWYGSSYWPLLLIIPLLSWSRVRLRRHTVMQTIGGGIYGLIASSFAGAIGML